MTLSFNNSFSFQRLVTYQLRADARKQKQQDKEISKQNKAQGRARNGAGRKGNQEVVTADPPADPPANLPEALQPPECCAKTSEVAGSLQSIPEVNKRVWLRRAIRGGKGAKGRWEAEAQPPAPQVAL